VSLLRALAQLLAHDPEAGPGAAGPPPGPPPIERRRRDSCVYRADVFGDRVEGYDGTRRVAWLEAVAR
jgi:hypothetical protein